MLEWWLACKEDTTWSLNLTQIWRSPTANIARRLMDFGSKRTSASSSGLSPSWCFLGAYGAALTSPSSTEEPTKRLANSVERWKQPPSERPKLLTFKKALTERTESWMSPSWKRASWRSIRDLSWVEEPLSRETLGDGTRERPRNVASLEQKRQLMFLEI